jgi:hypothetical protein
LESHTYPVFHTYHRNKLADFAIKHFSYLQPVTTQASNQVVFQAQTISGFIFFATAHNPWLQSRTPNSCNHTLAQFFFFFFFAVIEINQQFSFAMTHFSFLQSLITQACNHIPNNLVSFSTTQTKSGFLFFCNRTFPLVAITHWLSFSFSFYFLQS